MADEATDASVLAVGVETDGSIGDTAEQLQHLSKSARETVESNEAMLDSWARDATLMNSTKTEILAYDGALAGLTASQQEYLAEIIELTKVQEQYAQGQKQADALTRELTKAWDEAIATQQRMDMAAQKFVDTIKAQADSIGKSRSELLQMSLATQKLSDEQMKAAQTAIDQIRSQEKLVEANKAVAAAQKEAAAAQREAEAAAREKNATLKELFGNLVKIGSAIYLAKQAWDFLVDTYNKAVEAGKELEQNNYRLEAAIKATGGAAGISKGKIEEIAESMSKLTQFDDDGIKKAATSLLTFQNIGAASFERVLKAGADFAAFTGTDLDSAMKTLGKSMEDPERGMTQLRRAGIFLTDSQKELVKSMDAAGDIMGAQDVILTALEGKIGGVAEAMNGGMTKASNDLAKATDDVYKAIGQTDVVIFTFTKTAEILTGVMNGLQRSFSGAGTAATQMGIDSISPLEEKFFRMIDLTGRYGRALDEARGKMAAQANPGNAEQEGAGQQVADALFRQGQAAEFAAKKAREAEVELGKLMTKNMSVADQVAVSNAEIRKYGESAGWAASQIAELQRAEAARLMKKGSGGSKTNALAEITREFQEEERALQQSLETQERMRKTAAQSQIKDIQFMQRMQIVNATQAANMIEEIQMDQLRMERQTINERIAIVEKYYDMEQALPARNAAERKTQHDALMRYEKEIADLKQKGAVIDANVAEAQKRADQARELALKKQEDGIRKIAEQHAEFLAQLDAEQAMRTNEIRDIGLTAAEQARLNEQRKVQAQITAQFYRLFAELQKAHAAGNELEEAAIVERINLLGQEADARIRNAGVAAESAVIAKQNFEQAQQWASDLQAGMSDFFVDLFQNGSKSFENLWDKFKEWGLRAMAEMASKQIIISIIGALGMSAPGGGGGGGFDLSSLFGGGGGGGSFDLGKLFSGGSGGNIMDTLGSSWTNFMADLDHGVGIMDSLGTAFSNMSGSMGSMLGQLGTGVAIGGTIGKIGASLFGNERNSESMELGGTIGGTIGMLWGPIGSMVGAAIGSAIGSLIKSGGGPKSGGFSSTGDISSITGTDNGGRWFTPNSSDGALEKTIGTITQGYEAIARALGLKTGKVGFALGFDTDPEGTAPNRTHSGTFINGQQVYDNAQGDLGRDPAALEAAMATEAKRMLFAAIQASLEDAPSYIAQLFEGIDAATQSGDQIDTIINTAQALQQIADTIEGMGEKFSNMDAAQIQGLVDAFGGIAEFSAASSFLAANFTTSSDRIAEVSEQLNTAFEELGYKLPETHEGFMEILNGLDLTDSAQQQTYASLVALAPAFVAVAGSADQAAQAEADLAEARTQAIADAQEIFETGFFSDTEQLATRIQRNWDTIHDTWNESGDILMTLGVKAIPTTNAGFRALLMSLDQNIPAQRELYNTLLLAAPAVLDLNDAIGQLGNSAAQQYFDANFMPDPEDQIIAFWGKVHDAWNANGQELLNQGFSNIPTATGAFRDFVNEIDRSTVAGEALYQAMLLLAPSIVGLNGAVSDLGDFADDAVNQINTALARSQEAASATQETFSKIFGAIEGLVNDSGGNFGDKLALRIKLIPEQIARLEGLLEQEFANGGFYTPLAAQLKLLISQMQALNGKSVAELARFTVLTAQYGDAKAEQLVELENWFVEQKEMLAGSTEALAALQVIFDQKWQAIIDGVAGGVDDIEGELERLRKSIREFLDSLKLSDLSPLNPREKLDEAARQYQELLAKANAGDTEAMAQITSAAQAYLTAAREFYGSAPDYTEIFNQVVAALELLATEPSVTDEEGEQTQDQTNAAIVAALPEGGKLASSADMVTLKEDLQARMAETTMALIETSNANTSAQISSLGLRLDQLIDKVGSGNK